jgi:hypothetical protein
MNKIKVTVDSSDLKTVSESEHKNMLDSLVSKLKKNTIEVDAKTIANNIEEIYSNLIDSVSNLPKVNDAVEIDKIEFSIVIDSSGNASLLSAIGVSGQVSTGITFSIKFKK